MIIVASVCVILSPINYSAVETYRLTGRVMEWGWVRLFSPFVNLYAVTFLIGGAILSAVRFRRNAEMRHRYIGNVLIAMGVLLPGIGGTFTRFGHLEVLYVTELIGLLFIYAGFHFNTARLPSAARCRRACLEPELSREVVPRGVDDVSSVIAKSRYVLERHSGVLDRLEDTRLGAGAPKAAVASHTAPT